MTSIVEIFFRLTWKIHAFSSLLFPLRGQGSVSNGREEPAGCGNQEGFSTVSVILPFTAGTLLLPRWHYPPPRVRSYRESVATEIVEAWKRTPPCPVALSDGPC